MVTVDQFCDDALMEEMAAAGCLGVAVGVESVDDNNCAAVSKYQNLQQPFVDAVHRANRLGIQTIALIMVGLPHDSPQALESTLEYLKHVPCAYYRHAHSAHLPEHAALSPDAGHRRRHRELVAGNAVLQHLQRNASEQPEHALPT